MTIYIINKTWHVFLMYLYTKKIESKMLKELAWSHNDNMKTKLNNQTKIYSTYLKQSTISSHY